MSRLKDHLVINGEEFIHKEPSAVSARLAAIAIGEHPYPVHVLDLAMDSAQLRIVEPDVAVRHPSYQHLLVGLVDERLVSLRPIDEFQLDSRVLITCVGCTVLVFTENIDCHVGVSKGNDEAVFEFKGSV